MHTEPWRPHGESNPAFQVESLASLPIDDADVVRRVGVEPTQPGTGGLQPLGLTYVQPTHGSRCGNRTHLSELMRLVSSPEDQPAMEPVRGIEPLPLPYEGSVLPLSLNWHGALGGNRTLTASRPLVSETSVSTYFHHRGMCAVPELNRPSPRPHEPKGVLRTPRRWSVHGESNPVLLVGSQSCLPRTP